MKPIDYFLDKCNRIDEGNGFIADEKFYKAIEEYSIQLCKEQREICLKEFEKQTEYEGQYNLLGLSVINAPLPEL